MQMWQIQLLLMVMMSRELVSISRNIGTTLFDPEDLTKDCWGRDTVNLLNDRIIADDLLPDDDIVPRIDAEYVLTLVEYFTLTMDTVRSTMKGYRSRTMSLACADIFGGFLRAEVLPRARMEYYAGNLPYEDMCILYQTLSIFKSYLRTDGKYWKPLDIINDYPPAVPIEIPEHGSRQKECNKLITYPRDNMSSFVIPLPFIDDKFEPSTVAVPFKQGALYKLQAPYSAMIIAKYYVSSMKCLKGKSSPQDEINGFCEYLYVWLIEDVVPVLPNEEWYAGFGGVLRILESMKRMGIATFSNGKFLMPEHKTKFNQPSSIKIGCDKSKTSTTEHNSSSILSSESLFNVQKGSDFELFGLRLSPAILPIVLVAFATAVTMWLLVLLLFCCCKCSSCSLCCRDGKSGGTFYNVFVSFFYMIRDSLNPSDSIKTGQDVERQAPTNDASPAVSAGKYATGGSPGAYKSSTNNSRQPSSTRQPFEPYHHDEDETLTDMTTESEEEEDDEYSFNANNSLRKVISN